MNQEVFKPVRGTEASILSQVPQKGYVFFATDTRKIYYGDGNAFIPMGGNTGVWYGTMEYAETPEEGQVEFDFNIDEIEGNEDAQEGEYHVPNVDDLIFNTPDGCFYRVVEIDAEGNTPVLHCYKLTVAGSGGGGGTGGGGTGSGSMTVSRIGDQTINTLQGNSCYIRYKFIATDASGEETGSGSAALYVGGILQNTYVARQGENEIDVGPYLEIGTNAIRLVVSGSIGGTSNITQSKNWTVVSTNLALTWNYDESTINTDETFTFDWSVSISLAHTTHIVIDGVYTIDIPSTSASRDKTYIINRSEYGMTHGSHEVRMYATTTIGSTTFTSAAITHNIICVDENRSDTIISVHMPKDTMDQYDTISIPIILYDPLSADGKVSAILREDGVDKDAWNDYNNGVVYYWNYTPTTPGEKILSILSGTSEKVINLTVNDLGLSVAEIPGYTFRFKASDITSNNVLQNWSQGSVVPSFSEGFDWANGGLKLEKDEQGNDRSYICVKAGNRMSFNYQPLANTSKNTGFTMKIVFKANECRKYDAQVLTVGTAETDDVYLTLLANEGVFKSNKETVTVPYCEDSYIEFEVDIWPDGSTPYLMSWLDGVPSSAKVYESTDYFFQSNPKNIIIGSDDCDVQIYMIKVYQKHLTNEQHLTNFIMDASSAEEIVNRFNRNNILDDNGEISYAKLIEKNPNCDVYLYEIPRMTTNKKDFVEGCSYRRYKGNTSPQQTAENVTMSVQGTSSAAYGLAAFNFDANFVDGMTDYSNSTSGEHIDNWAMNEKSMPVNYFNFKVNVASCEGTNNALNQEWYDRYVPYVTEYHAKCAADDSITYSPRNTIEFGNMGVIFIKDNNQTANATSGVENNVFNDTPGYISNPYYKMYSICNMGNSKKNKAVFTDPSNKYEVIMEVSDNQMEQQQMTSVAGLSYGNTSEAFTIGDSTVFEWRNKPSGSMMVTANDAWLDLVKWFADNNPDAATGEDLDEEETYPAYTFRGYTSAVSGYAPAKQVLAGIGVNNGAVTISRFAGTYTKDTYNRRMAKMLSECEDHLIMDAMVFHYLFIERHCLIDNVAKNTFWHTEDLQHWSMIKDYDNDTSDGNDNSGNLNLTYGYEVLDHKDHDPNKSFVFNASSSVWLHFINELLEARTTMYQYLDTITTDRDESTVHGAWKAVPYLEKFDAWQSSLPERIWIEDYYRKYLRPREVYGATQFLPMLEGGKKTHQRKQFETYQQYYMASEYQGSEAANSLIDIRANGSNINEMLFPVTMYADSYIRVAAGSGSVPNVRVRARRGQTYNITLPVTGTANDMTTYFYLAQYITSLGNVHMLMPKKVDISAAYRMKEFSMGSLDAGYSNTNLEEVSFSNNRMLERLEAQNCPNISNALDLTASTNLKYLDIRGSGFTGITLADSAPVETLYLNHPTTLSFNNLSKISTFSIGYDNLNTLYLNNIDDSIGINSKTLVEGSATKLNPYNLQNVKWVVEDSSEISDTNIDILDILLAEGKTPYSPTLGSRIDKSLALSGTLTVKDTAYSVLDSEALYEKYAIDPDYNFPNLDLVFEGSARLYNVQVIDGNGNVVWRKKAGAGYELNAEFFATGPDGAFDAAAAKTKINTAANTFNFSNWLITGDGISDITLDTENPYYGTALSADITIEPVFTTAVRKYTITFMNGQDTISAEEYDYGTQINTILPTTIPSKDDSGLGVYETYAFLGYALMATATTPLVLNDSFVVNSDATYYAVYSDAISTDASRNVDYDNFTFTAISYTDPADSSFNIASGYHVQPKEGISLSGKITIPAYYNNLPVISIGGFGSINQAEVSQNNITGIFFETGTQIRKFSAQAFANMSKLIYLEIPDSLRIVDDYAVQSVKLKLLTRVQGKNDTTYYLGTNSSNLYSLGQYAFADCVDNRCTTLYITPSIVKTSTQSPSIANFNGASNLAEIYIGNSSLGSRLDVTNAQSPLRMNNSGTPPLRHVYLYLPLEVINAHSNETLSEWINPYYYGTTQAGFEGITVTPDSN